MLSGLNDSQRAAVEWVDGSSLVIAGAGSGKTRVLTYKIAYLMACLGAEQCLQPWEIMALTFTNKAAREMKERIGKLVGEDKARLLRMGTFHSIFSHILRVEAEHLGFTGAFTIYDDADSKSLCKAIIKERQLDDKLYKPTEVLRRISDAKNRLIDAAQYAANPGIAGRDAADKLSDIGNIYKEYERRCVLSNAMDFDDLLLNTYKLFAKHPEVLQKYQSQFRFYLVDEYQDTNFAQQQIMLQLTSSGTPICVVGDDAQSIYGFRGANIDNILNFQKHYPNSKLFKLEQNYRSTQRIVEAANILIHKNQRQIPKEVFSKNDVGEQLLVRCLASDREESAYVTKDIMRRHGMGQSYDDFAILYRTNSQSRTFEEELKRNGVPYQIYGGMSFYQRKEIKDIVAYLRLLVNPDDEEAFKRVVNYPTRGIGDSTVKKIADEALKNATSMWHIAAEIDSYPVDITTRGKNALKKFVEMINQLHSRLYTDDAYTLGKEVVRASGISQEIYSSTDPEYLSRQENMEEFLNSMSDFVATQQEQGEEPLMTEFLKDVALLTDRDKETDEPSVRLMTIHSAKGLEFSCVYIVGVEEGIFPSPQSTDSPRWLEEERRLMYVAITRAEKNCIITHAKMRYKYGNMEFGAPSRFLREIGNTADYKVSASGDNTPFRRSMNNNRPVASVQMASPARTAASSSHYGNTAPQMRRGMVKVAKDNAASPVATAGGFSVGDKVIHDRFGNGEIKAMEGAGDSVKATVEFEISGTKQLLLKFAKLRKL